MQHNPESPIERINMKIVISLLLVEFVIVIAARGPGGKREWEWLGLGC